MNSGKFKHIIYIILCLTNFLTAFSAVGAEKIEECFFRAHLTNPAQFGPVDRFEDKLLQK